MTRNFLLGEGKSPTVFSYLQNLSETLEQFRPRSQQETRRLEMAKYHLKEIKKRVRQLNERVNTLEEQVKILEERRNEKITS